MPLTLDWVRDLQFTASDDAGHGLVLESKKDGIPSGFSPMQLLLISQAGCMAMDVVSILKKKRVGLAGFRVLMDGARASQHPKRFTDMNFVFEARGKVPPEALEEAIQLSKEKYCSVSATIQNGTNMKIESRVIS
ncbi:MAG: OsmC family protein [Candidatus Edwardsbacteria bacterium]|nr:OsmC family protein [Candidatus Edwardsbacteria bacterium]